MFLVAQKTCPSLSSLEMKSCLLLVGCSHGPQCREEAAGHLLPSALVLTAKLDCPERSGREYAVLFSTVRFAPASQ